jgi:hypothetical protein
LNAAKLAANNTFQFTFWAGNPLDKTAAFDLVVHPASARTIEMLSRQLRAEPVVFEEIGVDLMPIGADFLRNDRERYRGSRLTVELRPNARQAIHLQGTLARRLEPQRFTAVEIFQMSRDHDERTIGSIGVVVLGEG